MRKPKSSVIGRELAYAQRVRLLRHVLQTASRIELVVLQEYVEAIVPLTYGTLLIFPHILSSALSYPQVRLAGLYLAVMTMLPNRVYLKNMLNLSLASVLGSLTLYALSELISTCVIAVVIKRQLKLCIIHIAAFVLESQVSAIQGKLISFGTIAVQMPLIHFGESPWIAMVAPTHIIHSSVTRERTHIGNDFTFKFEWIRG